MRASNLGIPMLAVLTAAITMACGQPPAAPATPPAASRTAGEPAPAATVAKPAAASGEALAWLAGHWCGTDEAQTLEETWTAPRANEMLGIGRTLAGGRMLSFEYMRIVDIQGKLTFIGQPGGVPPTSFERSDGGADWIRFENRKHDYPQRIEYRRAGEGLHAEIGGPGAAGKEEVIAYNYTRCPAS